MRKYAIVKFKGKTDLFGQTGKSGFFCPLIALKGFWKALVSIVRK